MEGTNYELCSAFDIHTEDLIFELNSLEDGTLKENEKAVRTKAKELGYELIGVQRFTKGMKAKNIGIPMSTITKEKQRLAHLGLKVWNAGIKQGFSNFKGKRHTPTSIAKISKAKKGSPAWNKGKKMGKWSQERIEARKALVMHSKRICGRFSK